MLSTLALLVQDGWDHMDGDDDGMWLWGTLMMLTWVALIGVVAWLILRHGRDGGGTTADRPADTTPGRAHQILDERLASGDITPEEYRERRELLDRPPGRP